MDDVIDTLAGIEAGSALDQIRAVRADARREAQASFAALFAPADPGDVPIEHRYAVAAFIAGLHEQPRIEAFYRAQLTPTLHAAVGRAVQAAKGQGPYGRYPAGPLSKEDVPGPGYRTAEPELGAKLAAAFEHAHMLVFHPRDAAPERLQALLDAGWSTTGIVTLSQLVAFLSFQIRAIAGLRVLAASL